MTRVVAFPTEDVVAIIDDAPGGGDYNNPAAPRNLPALHPSYWLSNVKFHSQYDYYELLDTVQTVPITHTALAGASTLVLSVVALTITITGQFRDTDIILYAHNKGYVPPYMISYAGARLPAGTHLQIQGTGSTTRSRCISHWADDTNIYLHERAVSSSVQLDAVTLNYQVMIFNRPTEDPSLPLLSFDNADKAVLIDHGRIRSDRHYLRKALPLESSFDINLGPTMDLNDGFMRAVSGGVAYTEPGYGGSWAGPPFVPVSGVF